MCIILKQTMDNYITDEISVFNIISNPILGINFTYSPGVIKLTSVESHCRQSRSAEMHSTGLDNAKQNRNSSKRYHNHIN